MIEKKIEQKPVENSICADQVANRETKQQN